ncbi:MAG: DNA sulfur modification protein DndB [Thermodesulfobacteriota bacterium]
MTQNRIALPTLKGKMGDWFYYVTLLPLKEVAKRVSMVEEIDEIYRSRELRKLIQREVSNRTKDIVEYLKTQDQRFFNSLILGIHGGKPSWQEISIEIKNKDVEIKEEDIRYLNRTFGILTLYGDEKIFAIDGQHRAKAIRDAIKSKEEFKNEEVTAIFVAHKTNEEGVIRTRRLFTTLNRYAKPVTLSEIIALDEDDICAILTRELIDYHPLFQNDNISLSKGSSIPNADKSSFTNIVSLYKCINILLPIHLARLGVIKETQWNDFKKRRPNDKVVEDSKKFIFKLWDHFIESFPALSKYLSLKNSLNKAAKFRNTEGGHILFRPVGLILFFEVISGLLKLDWEIDDIFNRISKIEIDLNKKPWVEVLWESKAKRMITRKENKKAALWLCYYILNIDLSKVKTSEDKLKGEYASLLNKEISEVKLPEKVH